MHQSIPATIFSYALWYALMQFKDSPAFNTKQPLYWFSIKCGIKNSQISLFMQLSI